jgi:DMSO/TMAO reductase YedYZ heme-binding membrane subunit
MTERSWLEGWRLTAVSAALIALAALTLVLADAGSEAGLRAAIRLTARTSFVLFVLAFVASSAAQLLPSVFTRWQLRNRRYLGLGFAASHGWHGLAILAFAQLHPQSFAEHTRTTSIAGGLVAYAFIAAMAAASCERSAAWLGPRAWKLLHVVGGLVIWVAFFKATFVRTAGASAYWLPVAILVAAMALRIASWLSTARATAARLQR